MFRNGFGAVDRAWRWLNETKEKFLLDLVEHIPSWITPNLLSWGRIVFASAILVMLFWYPRLRVPIIICFIVAVVGDILDGPIARRRGQETEEGALLDRLGDKLLICPMVVRLLWQYHPLLGAIVVVSEVFSIPLAVSAMTRGVPTESNWLAKWKMAAQSIGVIIMLFLPQRTTWAFGAFVASLPLGAGSVWDYFKSYITKTA